ncbi:MAG: putative RNA uridine N3 methyltransferase [Nitrosopumilaceae archaeon]
MKISIAIPDSSIKDESTQLGKSMKISLIARACAIFRIQTIYIYHESSGSEQDRSLLRIILKYLETPQYLRRGLFQKISELRFAGSLSPLKIPHHSYTSDSRKIKAGDIREGMIIFAKGKKYVDVGLDRPVQYFGEDKVGRRVSMQFKTDFPELSAKQISRNEIMQYWGYEIRESANLRTLLTNWGSDIILTSKKGKTIHKMQKYFDKISDNQLLVVFGSPERGLHEILGKAINEIPRSQILNFFPEQATETVRLEEAILGTLAILNVFTRN